MSVDLYAQKMHDLLAEAEQDNIYHFAGSSCCGCTRIYFGFGDENGQQKLVVGEE